MKAFAASARTVKSAGGVTLREARAAAKAVMGDRPHGKFLIVKAATAKSLRSKYLGEIVHGSPKPTGGQRVFEIATTSPKRLVGRRLAKKK
jgi:hypothetical protein